MREHPIIFSAPMVRAILEGRKMQTRRVCKGARELSRAADWQIDLCPYGQRGDRLWVRETWGVVSYAFDEAGDRVEWTPDRPAKPIRDMRFGKRGYYTGHVIYAADGSFEWTDEDDGELRSAWKPCMAIDRYDRVADNLAAIAATLDAMRAIERHGGAEILNRAFTGFAALPDQASDAWWIVLGVPWDASRPVIDDAYRHLRSVYHPDKAA